MKKFCMAFGLMIVTLTALSVISTHKASAATYCFMLGDPANGDASHNNACLTAGQTAPPELHGLSGGMSSAAIANTFINDINSYASKPYSVDKVGAAYVKQVLQQNGGSWTSNLQNSVLSIENVPASAGCANTAYDPSSNSVVHINDCAGGPALVARQRNSSGNMVIVFVIRLDCGNVMGNFPGPHPDRNPTGSLTATCTATATGGTYAIKMTFSDADGPTTGQIRSKSGATLHSSNSSPNTWTVATTSVPPGDWPLRLYVNDIKPTGSSGGYQPVGSSLAITSANCPPKGSIAAVSCYQVTIKLFDPNDPTDNIKYALSINGGAKQTVATAVSPNVNHTVDVSGVNGFDYWTTNTVTLYGVDNQASGTQPNLGTATLSVKCASLSCGNSNLAGQTLVAGVKYQLQVSVIVHKLSPNYPPAGPKNAVFQSITLDSAHATNVGYTYGTTIWSSPLIPYTPQQNGDYTTKWTFGGGQSNPNPVGPCTAANPTTVVYEPYFTAAGGDVSAGQGFGLGCTDTNPSADVAGENFDGLTLPTNYFGASSRQAAIATGKISQFATDTTNNLATNVGGSSDGLATLQPGRLALANTTASGTTYGGNILDQPTNPSPPRWCVNDYASNVPAATAPGMPTPAALSAITTKGNYVYKVTGDQTTGGFTLNPGVHVTIVVTSGNVFINGDIMYAGYTQTPDIPQFTLIVNKGNIYVKSSAPPAPAGTFVDELHGTYIAEPTPPPPPPAPPTTPTDGFIYTCASAANTPSTDYDTCNRPLIFYGAVSAGEIVPGRTLGNLATTSSISDHPAEQFVFTPELWLGSTSNTSTGCAVDHTQPQCAYESYTSLPPVL